MSMKTIRKAVIGCAVAAAFTLASAAQLQAMPRLHQTNGTWDGSPVVVRAQTKAPTGFFEELWGFLTHVFGATGATIDPDG